MNEEPMILSDELKRSGDTRWLTRSEGGVVPSGAILMFDTACPAGWTRFTALDNKFPRGAATYGGTGGADSHTHPGPSHTHDSNFEAGSNDAAANVGASSANGAYVYTRGGGAGTTGLLKTGVQASGTGNTGSTSNVPSYLDVVWCKKN